MSRDPFLTEEQKQRYQRQLSIPEIGVEGQIRLRNARVLIVGLGGLGSVSSFYLAAGVGRLRIVDHDTVSLNNWSADSTQHS
jgi:adenylyltransferase/sulfurtransferase